MRKALPPTSSLNSPNSLLLSISANFSPVFSLWSPKAASRTGAPPFSLTSPISSSTLTPAIIPEDNSAWNEAPSIAPLPQPEYPLFSHGGLGCESVWQGSGSSSDLSLRQYFPVGSPGSNSTRRSASHTTSNHPPT